MNLKILLAFILLPTIVLSQGTSRGVASLKLPTTPFIGATGESFIADPTALQSILINPANITSRESYGVMFSHTEWIQDIRTEFLSIAAPFRYGSLALSIANTSVDGLELRTIPGPPIGIFNTQSTSFQLTYGIKVTETISLGIAPKYLYEKIFVDEATGWGIDIGTLYTSSIEGLTLGFALTNLGSLSAFRNERTDLPSQLRLGGTYSFSLDVVSFRTAMAFSSELGISVHHISIGTEATYNDAVTVRFGYETGYEYRAFSAGVGLRYSIVMIDYAYIPSSSQMGTAHIISIGFIL
ncbi:MAG: PorV/PorQ family protein [Bacteroidota bacterium]